MWDTGSSFTLITFVFLLPLANELGLEVSGDMVDFEVVSGASYLAVGILHNMKLRLHPKLELTLEAVRVVDSDRMTMILGQDVIGQHLTGGWKRKGVTQDCGTSAVLY